MTNSILCLITNSFAHITPTTLSSRPEPRTPSGAESRDRPRPAIGFDELPRRRSPFCAAPLTRCAAPGMTPWGRGLAALLAPLALLGAPALAQGPASEPAAIAAAEAAGGARIEADILGLVCDFCATALQKTFGRRPEVAAIHVDLDAKTLTLVLAPGASLEDAVIEDLITRSGYRLEAIRREFADAP